MARPPQQWLRLWFTFDDRVSRYDYIVSGLVLAAIKYLGDALMVWFGTGRLWTLTDYLRSAYSLASARLEGAPGWLAPALMVWVLPFVWIGVKMSMRRAMDAGRSPWLALLFFVPILGYLLMLALSVLPTKDESRVAPPPSGDGSRLFHAVVAIVVGAATGIGMISLSVYAFKGYGAALFLGTPFVVGALTAFLYNRVYEASFWQTLGLVVLTLAISGGIALVTAQEGAVCIAMAAPLALVIGAMGAVFGRWIASRGDAAMEGALWALIALPSAAALEGRGEPAPAREVRSSIVIDAPADAVWRSVIAFAPLPEPNEFVFRVGIAYPKSAEIRGTGVGAVRRCVFSTGAFVEPITVWEPGKRLGFDVTAQPRPMEEWSPYANLAPPHLDGYFRSRRGEFRLITLADGRTRLEGSTWYEMQLRPDGYWDLFADALIHRIHLRVLRHIKGIAEGKPS